MTETDKIRRNLQTIDTCRSACRRRLLSERQKFEWKKNRTKWRTSTAEKDATLCRTLTRMEGGGLFRKIVHSSNVVIVLFPKHNLHTVEYYLLSCGCRNLENFPINGPAKGIARLTAAQ